MKLIGRTLAILAAALLVVAFCLAIAALSGSAGSGAAQIGGHGVGGYSRQSGFNLGGIVEILPTLAIVAIVTAIVAPIKRRLLNKHRPGTQAHASKAATPAAS